MALNIQGANITARGSPNGQAPACDHLDLVPAAAHGPAECAQCLALGLAWTSLRACLTCGWVACSDESPGGHARRHYEETDHPVVTSLEPDMTRRWCYVHGPIA
ncbi:UBP-type zinc finger domain-containing protein [Planomonospora sp. ID67723]|uniref:UBP-type zinc finger domain-containing protein n=1 Tax=Planomonospora sp. ID67723 TaxID=2738134 RepID=UPI0018C4059E|nr:UBP-type zinc finger domain-containing protein [Planomonospora sp. ID67723]MBG0826634.1 UBP-type zinc finger domain-containing protein [Planomonospora sp. ID67723]